ncbi:metal-binding protein [Clostridium beijerinckii]|nr:metal-binding protein [Clostridium beijerinckii]
MKVQILDIISGKDRSKKIDYTFEMPQFSFEGDIIKPIGSCEVVGVISSDSDMLIVNAKIKADLEMTCSRCLDTFIYPIDIDIEERFTTNSKSQDDEAIVVMDDVLDITEIVETSIISTFPIQRVCKDDCKGLCQECGCNLNYNKCSCNKENVDIRFEALKGLFDNKEV